MSRRFSILSIVVMLACGPLALGREDTPEHSPPRAPIKPALNASNASGEVLLDSAIAAFDSHDSLSASARLQVHLLGHHLFGPGTYLQKGRAAERKIRFEMTVRGRAGKFVFTQINDSRRLWLLEELTEESQLRLLDLQRLREAGVLSLGETSSLGLNAISLGGLPGLMKSLQTCFQFGRAVRIEWNGMTVWAMRGVWRAEQLARLVGAPQQEEGEDLSKMIAALPEWVPAEVGLLLDTETLFPYRFEFLQNDNDSQSSSIRLVPIAIMELLDVRFDATIGEEHFDRPSTIRPTDITKEFLRRAAKKEETAVRPAAASTR